MENKPPVYTPILPDNRNFWFLYPKLKYTSILLAPYLKLN